MIMSWSEKQKKEEQSKPAFPDWTTSVTGGFGEEELLRLRDEDPAKIAAAVWKPGRVVQARAIVEQIAHGNPRKAAMIARELVGQFPIAETSLKTDLGFFADVLLTEDLQNLPSSPDEY